GQRIAGDAHLFPRPSGRGHADTQTRKAPCPQAGRCDGGFGMKRPRSHRLLPKFVESMRGYRRRDLLADAIAGLTVGVVALPLAMAFAISSGVKPEAGIYTAIIAGLVVSALGGSRCQIAGPTGAFVVIVAGIVAKFGVS